MKKDDYINRVYHYYWKGLLSREESKRMLTDDFWLTVQIRKIIDSENGKTVSPTAK